ncbi:hypothetical protein B9Z55_027449 [Caenorhabditis nigoni]|uniref:RING-type domain-containing protein n=2 Tax=Caenorhabditis nigoni TaxID=1611254 RepID=A0A2G5SG15_9PELO|nr:hypothetical protein B9Z55_027449 [Caenorhabditis nigoni]
MPISTRSFKETKLVDYCDRRDGTISTSKKGTDPNGKSKITYSNGEVLSSSYNFFLKELLEKRSINFFVLDESDDRWIRETIKLSEEDDELSLRVEELKLILKSLTNFVNHRENKRIYIREVWITSEKPSERRRVFTEEVLEIIPIILKQQNARIEEFNDLLQKYYQEWKRDYVHHSINMERFNSVLEEFNINKGLITIVPDPLFEMSREDMLEYGKATEMRLSPHGAWLLDSSHAIFSIFQRVVWGFNWKSVDQCRAHDKCIIRMKKMIIEVMRQYLNTPEGGLIPITCIDNSIEWLENQCYWTLGSKGTCLDSRTSISIDITPHFQSLYYHVYQQAMYFYGLPNYHSSVRFSSDDFPDWANAVIPAWLTRVLLLVGWSEQFFDKESVDLANVILQLILNKMPAESRNGSIPLLKSVQASIAGLTNIPPPETNLSQNSTTNRGEHASEGRQKMLRKAQKRAEKLRKRKEQSKPDKVKKPSTNVARPIRETSEELRPADELSGVSFLDSQEYPESKLKITRTNIYNPATITHGPMTLMPTPYHKEREFGNVPNVFSLLDKTETNGVMTDDEQPKLNVDEDLKTINEFKKEEQEVVELEEKDELIKEDDVKTLKVDDNLNAIDKFQKEQKYVFSMKELESEYVKALKKEVERRKEELTMFDDLKDVIKRKDEIIENITEKNVKLTKKVDELENELKSLELEVKRLKSFEQAADGMKKEKKEIYLKLKDIERKRDSDIKRMEEEKKKLMCSLDEKSRKVEVVEKQIKLKDSEMSKMKSELNRLEKQSEDQEKMLKEKKDVIERFKLEAENSNTRISEKDVEIARKNDELSESTETNESLVIQISRLEDEVLKRKIEEKEKNDNMQSHIQNIRNLCDQLSICADVEDPHQFRFTLQRLRNIKDRFQNKEQLKLARTMTDKLITMSNRSEIRELALYEYQQYEANFQNYTQLVDLNIQKMKETKDCSLYSPLPKPPAFSDRFMNEYWLECDKEKKKNELEDISDSECLICFFEMNSDQKTLKCDHCKKITHQKCASKWLQIHRSCPHCRREQLDPEEFPALS